MQVADGLDGAAAGRSWDRELAGDRLRLRVSTDLREITDITLDALVPGFADAAIVYAAEDLFRGSGPGPVRPVQADSRGRMAVRRAGARFDGGGPGSAVFPPGGAVVFDAASPFARCVRDGKTVVSTHPDDWTLNRASPAGRAVVSAYSSFLAVPLDAGGTAAGLIALARKPGRHGFGDKDIDGVTRLASCAGAGIAGVIAAERHRSIAVTLQRGLLAAEPALPGNLDVSGRCLAADGHLLGGDWYDIVGLPGGTTGIVVGDVMGHGVEAAAVMAQLRSAARALAQMDLEPEELLTRLNLLIATFPAAPMATCLYAVIDPGKQSCAVAAAGHLPPVLALPGTSARVLDLPSGLSLGIGAASYGQARIKLRPGSVIALYTDGLVETRGRSFDQGIAVLRSELADVGESLDAARDAIMRSLAADPEDDVTLILARVPG